MRTLIDGLPQALLLATLAALAVFYVSGRQAPQFVAHASMFVAEPAVDLRSLGTDIPRVAPAAVEIYREAVVSEPVLQRAREEVAGEVLVRSSINVRVENFGDSSLVRIDVAGADPQAAANAANALAQALAWWDEQRIRAAFVVVAASLDSQIDVLEAQLVEPSSEEAGAGQRSQVVADALARRRGQADVLRAVASAPMGSLTVLERAVPPTSKATPDPARDAVLAFILGLLVSYGFSLLKSGIEGRSKDADELATMSGLPVVAELRPRSRHDGGAPDRAASFIRVRLEAIEVSERPATVLFAGADGAAAAPTVARHVAESFASNGARTLLIDADLYTPSIAISYGLNVEERRSLLWHLEHGEAEIEPEVVRLPNGDIVHVLAEQGSVPASTATTLLSRGLGPLLQRVPAGYDVVLLVSAPVLEMADALVIAPLCSGTLMTVNTRTTRRAHLLRALDLMHGVDSRVIGIVAVEPGRGSSRGRSSSTRARPGNERRGPRSVAHKG